MDTQEQEFEERRLRSYARHFASLDGLIYDPQNRANGTGVLHFWFCSVGAGPVVLRHSRPRFPRD